MGLAALKRSVGQTVGGAIKAPLGLLLVGPARGRSARPWIRWAG
ncbi:hypothetical protein [Streptomyces salinarius]|uniref:Uncharacterized protein n=1 Tax=Streptomyces salinarius TaxID=2762598 RepID=A0ABW8BBI1_9ACTN